MKTQNSKKLLPDYFIAALLTLILVMVSVSFFPLGIIMGLIGGFIASIFSLFLPSWSIIIATFLFFYLVSYVFVKIWRRNSRNN